MQTGIASLVRPPRLQINVCGERKVILPQEVVAMQKGFNFCHFQVLFVLGNPDPELILL